MLFFNERGELTERRAIKCIRQCRRPLVDPSSLIWTASRGDEIRSSGRSGLEQRGASIDTKRPS
jgi:hypothetical protein